MKGVAEQVVVAASEREVDKEKKRRRRQNRRTKLNMATVPDGGCSSLGSACACGPSEDWIGIMGAGPISASEIAFKSLPSMHLNSNGGAAGLNSTSPLASATRGEISKSCPLPGSSTSIPEVPAGWAAPLLNPKQCFDPHWPNQVVEEAIKKGRAFKATFRVNAHNRLEAYCTIDGLPIDVLINGISAQNRATEGDIVAVMLDPVANWTKLKGVSVCRSSVQSDNLNRPIEAGEVIDKIDAKMEEVNAYCKSCAPRGDTTPSDTVYQNHESSGFIEATSSDLGNGCLASDNRNIGCNFRAPTNSDGNWGSDQEEAARALERICAMISSNQFKRPTGRVLSILQNSSRREAIIGFLAMRPWFPEGDNNGRQSNGTLPKENKELVFSAGLDYIQLIPIDSKFPKMVVTVENLPDGVKERLTNGDISIEQELVVARIDEWSEESLCPEAQVMCVLGRGGEIEPQMNAILFENALIYPNFSPESLTCIPNVPWEVPMEELKSRTDLRNICTFTIDPSSAIDLDDAISIEKVSDNIFRVGVHITDVSYFVLPDTALDSEAHLRSTSVYILQHKLPMLPPKLSEVCSLLPGLDRLALSVIWEIDDYGNIMQRWFGRTVINSCCKLSYDNVQELIDIGFDDDRFSSGKSVPQLYGNFELKNVVNSVRSLYELSKKLKEIRFNDGALWLENSKLVILFDENGSPCDSFLNTRKESCCLVEEFMLLANKSAAEVISKAFPDFALLRRHPEPNLRKLKEFEGFCSKHGFELDSSTSGKLHHSLSKIREKLKNDPVLFDILIYYATKHMQSATYFCTGVLKGRENDWAHYGLSIPLYTHFTSPLRRYPDIIVHRTLSAVLEAEELYVKERQNLVTINGQVSGDEFVNRCFTGLSFDMNAAECEQGRIALSTAALKHKVPGSELLAEVAAHCNGRKLASKHAEEAGVKLYLWTLLKKSEVVLAKARVLALGPKFMTIYLNSFAIERRIYYDDVEGLAVDWLETTGTLVLDLPKTKPFERRGRPGKFRAIDEVALLLNISELVIPEKENEDNISSPAISSVFPATRAADNTAIVPMYFPSVLQNLSTIPVALHAVGGHNGPIDIVARLYACSYFK